MVAMVVMATFSRSSTSWARDFIYTLDATIHEIAFSCEIAWDNKEYGRVPKQCRWPSDERRGMVGQAYCVNTEAFHDGIMRVVYDTPIVVRRVDRALKICIPYAGETHRFTLDAENNVTWVGGGLSSKTPHKIRKKAQREFTRKRR